MVGRWPERIRAKLAGRRTLRAVVAGVAVALVLAVGWTVAVAATAGSATAVSGSSGRTSSGTAARAPVTPGEAPLFAEADDSDAGSSMAVPKRVEQAPARSQGPISGSIPKPGAPASPGTPDTPDTPGTPGKPASPDLPGDLTSAQSDRAVARTARLSLAVGNVADAAARVRSLAAGVGGFVAAEQSSDRASTFTLRVPTDRLDEVTGQLADVGRVTERAEQADDVTDQLADLEGRLATQRASVARVRALLERATTVGDVVSIESELSQREADLESLQRRLAAVGGRAALSTLTVRLAPEAGPVTDERADTGFLGGLSTGWRAFLAAGGVLLTVLGVLLPFLVTLGLVAGLALLARRTFLARRRRASA